MEQRAGKKITGKITQSLSGVTPWVVEWEEITEPRLVFASKYNFCQPMTDEEKRGKAKEHRRFWE